jgi:hypothetical protein
MNGGLAGVRLNNMRESLRPIKRATLWAAIVIQGVFRTGENGNTKETKSSYRKHVRLVIAWDWLQLDLCPGLSPRELKSKEPMGIHERKGARWISHGGWPRLGLAMMIKLYSGSAASFLVTYSPFSSVIIGVKWPAGTLFGLKNELNP